MHPTWTNPWERKGEKKNRKKEWRKDRVQINLMFLLARFWFIMWSNMPDLNWKTIAKLWFILSQ